MKKSVYYWSPCLTKVGTVKSTLNSAISLAKYSKLYNVKILNVFGEWNNYKKILKENDVVVEDLTFNYYNFLPKNGFISSRISYTLIILISFIPLMFFFKKRKPDFFIIHLLTSLPLILINLFNLKTNMILRISGYPRLNFLRKKLWVFSEKKLFHITCPSLDLKKSLIENKIFKDKKLALLYDAILNIKDFINKKKYLNLNDKLDKSFFLAIGRLTKQKNYIYLINEFEKLLKKYPNEKLIIIGEGELKKKIENTITKKNLSENITLYDYTDNVYSYMKKSKAFVLSSLWEEIGFVIVEAAFCNTAIISSNCMNGPKEFLLNGKAGLIFENNRKDELFKKLVEFKKLEKEEISKKRLLAKKNSKNFTMFRHYLGLSQIIQNN
tara:strand:+ start:17630 stop:18778 length:1149 start_codon:yes stop_codon:yes gene_type:complete